MKKKWEKKKVIKTKGKHNKNKMKQKMNEMKKINYEGTRQCMETPNLK